jgi:hypothetical protein
MAMISEVLDARKMLELEYQWKPAIIIQQAYRRWDLRRQGIVGTRRAAVKLQTYYRGYRARSEVNRLRARLAFTVNRLPNQLMAAVLDKRKRHTRYRPFRVGERAARHTVRLVRLRILPPLLRFELEENVLRIQALARRYRRKRAVRNIQRVMRGSLARRHLRQRHAAAVVLQSSWRGFTTRSNYYARNYNLNISATKLVALIRGFLARRRLAKARASEPSRLELEEDRPIDERPIGESAPTGEAALTDDN